MAETAQARRLFRDFPLQEQEMRIRSAEPSEVLHNSNLQEKVVPRDIRPLYTDVYRGLFCALAMSRARYREGADNRELAHGGKRITCI